MRGNLVSLIQSEIHLLRVSANFFFRVSKNMVDYSHSGILAG